MELKCHLNNDSMRAKTLWKVLKIVFSVIRKAKAMRKLVKKSLQSKIVMTRSTRVGSFGVADYEFSCTNSPNPLFFRATKRKQFVLFPTCLCFPEVLEEDFGIIGKPKVMLVTDTPDYLYTYHLDASFDHYDKRHSLLLSPNDHIRVSDYLSVEEDDGSDKRVDHEAEDFIKKFHEQLRLQKSPINLRS